MFEIIVDYLQNIFSTFFGFIQLMSMLTTLISIIAIGFYLVSFSFIHVGIATLCLIISIFIGMLSSYLEAEIDGRSY